MTARKTKPKPKPRKASVPVAQHLDSIESVLAGYALRLDAHLAAGRVAADQWREVCRRLDALESRDRLRDKSHDEPVSNASEAIGHLTVAELPRPWWRRFLAFMGAP